MLASGRLFTGAILPMNAIKACLTGYLGLTGPRPGKWMKPGSGHMGPHDKGRGWEPLLVSSGPPSVKTTRAVVVSSGKQSCLEERKMKAKSLISQIQSALNGGTLAQRYIQTMRQTWREAPESIRNQFMRRGWGFGAEQKAASAR